jgi:glycerate kinase
LIQEGLNYERILEKKFDLPLIGICGHTRQHIEQLDSYAIDLLHQYHGRMIGLP